MIIINLLFVLSFLTRLVFGSESQKPPSDRDILLQGGTIITFNKENSALEPLVGSILISNGTIKEIGQKIDVADDVEIIDATGTIVSPGFVDTHRHGWQTMYRTMGGNITLPAYYYSFGEFGAGAAIFEPEDVYISQLMGIYEAMSAGVTSIVDHAHHTWSKETAEAGLKASIDSGNRVWWCYTVHPVVNHTSPYNLDFSATTWQLDQIDEISRRGKLGDGRVTLGLAYDGLQGTKESVMEVFKFVT
jgi:cytosine/adenosine deaminase-related metal-dependent hydrolase